MAVIARNWRGLAVIVLGILALAWLILQLIPLDRDNPPVVSEPAWDNSQTRVLAQRACFDCHSNETIWPWYSKVAPARLLIWKDVRDGRDEMNFSDWARADQEIDEIAEVIREGEMPPWYYTLMHPNAKLSAAEKQALIDGLSVSLPPGEDHDSD